MQVKDKIYLRQNIQEVTEIDELGELRTFYEYDEIVVQGYSADFISNRISNIFTYPNKYNVIQQNGKSVKNPKGTKFAELQESELQGMEEAIDTLLIDNLDLTQAIDVLIIDSLGG
jgi:hypothetical protein